MDVKPLKELHALIQGNKENKSLTKKHLTESIVAKYENVKTPMGGTLAHCVNSNAYNPGALLPRAADLDCYETFRDFFDAIIKDYHKVKGDTISHPSPSFGDEGNLPLKPIDPTNKYVVSTRVRVGRTVKGFPFAPVITKEDRMKLEQQIADALNKLTGDLAGEYHSLSKMPENVRQQLVNDHFLFRDDDSVLRDAGGYRDWPSGRGIFHNTSKTFLVWINEEDHMRIISMDKGGDLTKVYLRLIAGLKQLEKQLQFVHHDRFGFITFCPSNLGTTMRASVHVKIPYVSQLPNFKEICEKYGLQPRGTGGEHTAVVGGVYDLSNKRRLGLTELDAAKEMAAGVGAIIQMEMDMEAVNKGLPAGLIWPVEPLPYLAQLLWDDKECKSITKAHLTPEIVEKFRTTRTKNGVTLAHCIRNCAYNHRALCPRTGDQECYELFKEYLDVVIRDYHGVKANALEHGPVNFGDLKNLPFGDLDPSGKYVVSTRVRVGRNVEGYCFPPALSKEKRFELEKKIAESLMELTGEHKGKYYPLRGMDEKTQKQLTEDHFLFKDDDPILRDAGGYRDWPEGRGIFHNDNKTFLVWVVEEDQMRIISMEPGGNLARVYKRLIEGIQLVEKRLKFMRNNKYGYLTCCPSNLGTTMRASVHVRIPKLSADMKRLNAVCAQYNLQARGFHGEHTESPEGIYDISNKRRLGLTELEAASEMAKGVQEIIKLESSM